MYIWFTLVYSKTGSLPGLSWLPAGTKHHGILLKRIFMMFLELKCLIQWISREKQSRGSFVTYSSPSGKRKHISTGEQTLTQLRHAIHWVNDRLLALVLLQLLSLSLSRCFIASSVSVVIFQMQCGLSTVIPALPGDSNMQKTMPLPVLVVQWQMHVLCAVFSTFLWAKSSPVAD